MNAYFETKRAKPPRRGHAQPVQTPNGKAAIVARSRSIIHAACPVSSIRAELMPLLRVGRTLGAKLASAVKENRKRNLQTLAIRRGKMPDRKPRKPCLRISPCA